MEKQIPVDLIKCGKAYHLLLIDKEGKILFANPGLAKILEHGDRLPGDCSIFDSLDHPHYAFFKKVLEEADKNNKKSSIDLSLKNGTFRETKWEVNKMLSSPSSIPSYLCIGYDMEDPETPDGNQPKSEHFFKSIFERFGLGIIIQEGSGEIIQANSKAAEILDTTLNSLYRTNSFEEFWKALNPDGQSGPDKEFPPIKTLQTSETHSNVKMIIKTRGKEFRSILFNFKPLFDDRKSVPIAVVSCFFDEDQIQDQTGLEEIWDINDKYKADRQMQKANERILHLSRLTSDAIWEWNMETGQMFRNQALQNLIGFQKAHTTDLTWWFKRIHPKDRDRMRITVRNAVEKKLESWKEEYEIECLNGSYKYVADQGYIIYENGKPMKMIGSIKDISVVKNLEALLKAEKLLHVKNMEETAIEIQMKERTQLGHELHDNVNQILSSANLYLDLLKPKTKSQRNIKNKVNDFIHMAIEEIRDLSNHLVTPTLEGNDLIESIGMVVDDINSTNLFVVKFSARNHIYLESLSENRKLALFRIVQEQMNNIVKYSCAKAVNISITKNDKGIQLDIHDDGVGFDINQNKKGIGLSNIFERAKLLNGSVDYQTSPGHGCWLTVVLPAE